MQKYLKLLLRYDELIIFKKLNKGENMINNKKELIKELKKNNGKIWINSSMLYINGVSFYDDCNIRMIYMDLDQIDNDDDIIEFCDKLGSVIVGIHLSDIYDFEQVCEYDDDGYII